MTQFLLRPQPKPNHKRIKPTQKQLGAISNKVRKQVAERSSGVCELCHTLGAVQMAHIIGRKQLTELTTAKLLLHVCIPCHDWLDKTIEGIRFKRDLSATATLSSAVGSKGYLKQKEVQRDESRFQH